jgi:hypothetical protein
MDAVFSFPMFAVALSTLFLLVMVQTVMGE